MQLGKPIVLNRSNMTSVTTGVNVMRPSKWGNPFIIGRDGTRDDVCDKFETYVQTQPLLISIAKKELRGKNLICCCSPLRCHAETWLRIANENNLKESEYI